MSGAGTFVIVALVLLLLPIGAGTPPQTWTFGVCDPGKTRCVSVDHNDSFAPTCSLQGRAVTCGFVLNATIRLHNDHGLPGEGKARMQSTFSTCDATGLCSVRQQEDTLPLCSWGLLEHGCGLHRVHTATMMLPAPDQGACVTATLSIEFEGAAALVAFSADPTPLDVSFPSLDDTTLCV